MKERKILHCDCNSFFASVELLAYPEIKDKPVAVGGSEETRHGIVLAKNEAAKKLGIKTAEPISRAREKCHDLIVLPPHHDKYEHYSRIINEIYGSYTDLVEPFGIDESWLDVTNSYQLFAQSAAELADMIRKRVYYETGLTLSIGVSFNKIFAKLGSDYKKPDATTVISPENYKDIVYPLPVESLIYVGKTTQTALNAMGIFTIGQLGAKSREFLEDRLGKHGGELYLFANGLEESAVLPYNAKREYKSVGSGNTFFRDLCGQEDIKPALMVLSEDVGMRLRRYGLFANGVQITIKTPEFTSFTRQCRIPSSNVTTTIYHMALKLFLDNWNIKKEVRALTVTAIDLTKEKLAKQTSMFETPMADGSEKAENLQAAIDKIRGKFGDGAVTNAAIIKTDIFKT
ncbi:MAG: DNA polymerase IV [Oscillospiraceae bacterium]